MSPRLAALVLAGSALLPAQAEVRDRVRTLLSAVDAARIEQDVRALVGFGTRHVLSRTDSDTEGTGAARRWLQARFAAIAATTDEGRLQVALQAATVPCLRPGMPRELPIVNVIATLRGTGDPERIYVVSGHYDSRNGRGEDGERAAPGAVDDASGTAAMLEACRVLTAARFPATIVFAAYDAEEQGLLGSAAHAAALADAGATVDGMITCDIVGNTLGMDGARYHRFVRCFSYASGGTDGSGRSLARAVTYAARTHLPDFDVRLILRGDRYGRGGDHRSFFEHGFPAVRFTEPREDFSRQHQDITSRDGRPYGDLPDYADFAYTANVTRVAVATLAELASAPPPPLAVSAALRRDRYDTELVYVPPPGAAACEFVWRETTAADWTNVVDAAAAALVSLGGGRMQATLAGVCLDDVVVGVRAIAADGSRSRVATPPEPDRFDRQRRARTAVTEDDDGQR
ncbi:MAG: M20/M25/M40 family metallo-hydrolase [Planctomycetes bacterium]|nr:M20/M25/M40 family metallo-hydrolase [Planctomycetota bacterium]